jgi:hypothetical protein
MALAGGDAASLYWDGNRRVALALARDGVALRNAGLATLADGLDPSALRLVRLIVVERSTGLRIAGDAKQERAPEYLTRRVHRRLPGS